MRIVSMGNNVENEREAGDAAIAEDRSLEEIIDKIVSPRPLSVPRLPEARIDSREPYGFD